MDAPRHGPPEMSFLRKIDEKVLVSHLLLTGSSEIVRRKAVRMQKLPRIPLRRFKQAGFTVERLRQSAPCALLTKGQNAALVLGTQHNSARSAERVRNVARTLGSSVDNVAVELCLARVPSLNPVFPYGSTNLQCLARNFRFYASDCIHRSRNWSEHLFDRSEYQGNRETFP